MTMMLRREFLRRAAAVPLAVYFLSGRWFVRGIAAGAVGIAKVLFFIMLVYIVFVLYRVYKQEQETD